jgi:hypothetical protein
MPAVQSNDFCYHIVITWPAKHSCTSTVPREVARTSLPLRRRGPCHDGMVARVSSSAVSITGSVRLRSRQTEIDARMHTESTEEQRITPGDSPCTVAAFFYQWPIRRFQA